MKFLSKSFQYILVILMAIITLFPFIYMLFSGLMTYQEATSIPPSLFPSQLNFANYIEAMSKAPFPRYFLNTSFVSIVNTLGTLITTILAAFSLYFMEFRFKNILEYVMIGLLMVPFEVVVFTNYKTIATLGILDTYWALILPFMASVFYIFYLKKYFSSIPKSYYLAAKVDGCTDLEFIWKILLPLSKNALFTIGLLNFITGWNSFMWPILVTNSPEMRLISNGLSAFATEAGSQVHLQMAASTIAIVPILLLYLVFRKQIIRGVSRSGLKG